MKKSITAMEARRNFGNMLNSVALKDDRYIIQRAGKPIAAVVSIGELQRMEQSEEEARAEFYATVGKMRKNAKGTKPKEIERVIKEAVGWARKKPA